MDLFDEHVLKKNELPRNYNTKNQLQKYYDKLIECKKEYAKSIGVDFILVEDYLDYYKQFRKKYPEITTYNIVNFYKLHLLEKFSKEYDEILYLDFDVVPNTDESFFEKWDLSKGICVLNNNDKVAMMSKITENTQTIRSPTSKYYNAQAMLFELGMNTENDVINTGIIGASKKHIKQLKYFKNFNSDIKLMTRIKKDNTMFPTKITKSFGYDNETLFSVKIKQHNVPIQWLDSQWHYFFDSWYFIPDDAKMIHAINKRFDIIWKHINA